MTKQLLKPIRMIVDKVQDNEINYKGLKPGNLNPEHMLHLDMIKQTYRVQQSRKNVGRFKYVPELSTDLYGVFKSDELNKIIVSIKGTTTLGETILDLQLTVGNFRGKSYRETKSVMDNVKSVYPTYTIELTGHSLGGTKVLIYCDKHNHKGIVFGPFIPKLSPFLMRISKNPNVTKYVIFGDIYSMNLFEISGSNPVLLTNSLIGFNGKHGLHGFYQLHTH